MTLIYCLYATSDGCPRYVGQTTKPIEVRLAQHLQETGRRSRTLLRDWIEATIRGGFQVRAHVLQLHVPVADLNLFERYWMNQFSDLVNDSPGVPRVVAPTKVGRAVERALQGLLPPPQGTGPTPASPMTHASSQAISTAL